MRAIAILLLCLNIINDVKTRDIYEDFDEIAINKKVAATGRFLKQANEELFRMSTVGCDPTTTNCASFLQEKCIDFLPPSYEFDCAAYVRLSLCDTIPQDYCQLSCGRCPEVCDDKLFPLTNNCSDIVEGNHCNDPEIKGIYCNKACGYCTVQAQEDPINLEYCAQPASLQCDIDALLTFKSRLIEGEWVLSSWVGDDPCADWKYIQCKNVDAISQRVSLVDFGFFNTDFVNKMQGKVGPEFSKMRYLEWLEISSQKLSGVLHKEFSVLDQLEYFAIYRTQLTGTLPPEYSVLFKITKFVCSYNSLSGNLPNEWSTWENLEILHISNNQFSSSIPEEFSTLQNIVQIDLGTNKFSGELPKTLSTLKHCEYFWVYETEVSGTLPPDYSTFKRLKELSIYDNFISGSLPVEYSDFGYIQQLGLFENILTGTLPPQYSAFRFLTRFVVQQNQLTGTLPPEYSNFIDANMFRVWGNRISGTLPPEYSNMHKMRNFSVSFNDDLTGTLPTEYSTMENMESFIARDTALIRTIPDQWSVFSVDVEIIV